MFTGFLSPRIGDGSRTLGVLFSMLLSKEGFKTLIVDARDINSIDLIVDIGSKIITPLKGDQIKREDLSLKDLDICEGKEGLNYLALEMGDIEKDDINKLLKLLKTSYDEIVILKEENSLDKFMDTLDTLILVSKQDNISLRYLDKFLEGKIRRKTLSKKTSIIINDFIKEDRNRLASLDEIYSFIEEDIVGIIPYSPSLRYYTNTGNLNDLSQEVIEEIKPLLANIFKIDKNNRNKEAILSNEGEGEKEGNIFKRFLNLFKRGD